ncbi:flagellar hook-associated protein FlgL [Shewanella salipaludis]|uniref:Flagellar hook-associated protein FlgL n=1 Tax=Shewanella salipaludis TaxID=2723052 RepID=A0A972JP17_9GAMM|nr:flagellar hook-associated protein FlgL [Shewanella salipaludis]NMH66726.1 flagellar hook-associated protein FlgL [Shewanella salipaludis]
MRVTMQNLYTNNVHSMQNTTAAVARLNQMLSTGMSILRPSDDPIGTVRVMASQRDLASVEQYVKNIDSLSTSMDRAETYLSGMVDLQQRMRELSVATNNSSLSEEDRAAYALEMEELLKSMVDMVNAKDDVGNSLFSGNSVDKVTVGTDAAGRYVYQGDSKQREVQTSASSWMTANVTAEAFLFSNASQDLLNQTLDYVAVLKDPSLAPGDPAFQAASVDMQAALNDTLDSINSAITEMGGKQNSLSLAKGSHEEMVLFNKQVIGETQELDYAKATAEFNVKLTSLKVTQQTFVQISQLTLFNNL